MEYRGSLFELIEEAPRTRIEMLPPGSRELVLTWTPAARPLSSEERSVTTPAFTSSRFMEVMAPARSRLRVTPYPTTRTSSTFRASDSSLTSIWSMAGAMVISRVFIPRNDTTRVSPGETCKANSPPFPEVTPRAEPLTVTVAPVMGFPDWASTTVPVRFVCARATHPDRRAIEHSRNFFIRKVV